MNLEEVQELRNSITEIRNDENLDHMVQHIGNLVGGSNPEHQAITAKMALDSLGKFQNSFDGKMQKIDDALSQIEVILSQNQ